MSLPTLINRIPRIVLLYVSIALVFGIYALLVVVTKFHFYPGWTWRGYASDAKTLLGAFGTALAATVWIWQLFHGRKPDESLRELVGRIASSHHLPLACCSLAAIFVTTTIVWARTKEEFIPKLLWMHIQQSNWSHAARLVDDMKKQPLVGELSDSLSLFVTIHEKSERDRLKDSIILRQDRERILGLLNERFDPDFVNSLTYAELCKAIHFVEKSASGQDSLNRGIRHLLDRAASPNVPKRDRAMLLSRVGELELAARHYHRARMYFEMALEGEDRPVPRSRIMANLGNVLASLSQTEQALQLYSEAEGNYPEGRRGVFYSNFGYLLMLSKRFDVAKQRIEQALQIDPTDWYSYLNLGLVKEEMMLFDDAIADFKIVIAKSEFPDSAREARILAGRAAELAQKSEVEYLTFYLEADGRAISKEIIEALSKDKCGRVKLYLRMSEHLGLTNTHGVEKYVNWFVEKAKGLSPC